LSVYVTLKILGIILLCSAVCIFECWFRFSYMQGKVTKKSDDVNKVMEAQAS
ncbi:hypothetical protein ILYODFUR_035115, partial [Ilyodon furcidens]